MPYTIQNTSWTKNLNSIKTILISQLFLAIILLNNSCKTVVEKVEFDTELEINIKNDLNQPIDSAIVAVYDDYSRFNSDISLGTITSAVSTTISKGGKANFDNLQPNISYWIASFYQDINRIPGVKITFNNIEINNELAIKLRKGSISYVDVRMKPQTGVVTFIAPDSEKKRLPMVVKFNNLNAGNIIKTFETNPSTLIDSTVHVLATKGRGYYVINSEVCSWYDVTSVLGGMRTFVKLQPCETGNIVFYSDEIATSEYPISLTLNSTERLPALTIGKDHNVQDCGTTNIYKIEKAIGTLTYTARTASGKCFWVGNIEVKLNQCTIIKLPKCL